MSTATDDDTTVTITSADGETVGPFTVDDIELGAARLRDGRSRSQRQLTFDVGKAGGEPDFASLKIAGDFGLDRDLKRRAEVHVVVTDHFGEVLVEGDATVTSVQFKDKEDSHGNVTTERIHTVTLG